MKNFNTQQQGEIKLLQKWAKESEGEEMSLERAQYIVYRSIGSYSWGVYLDKAINHVVNYMPDFYDHVADEYNL